MVSAVTPWVPVPDRDAERALVRFDVPFDRWLHVASFHRILRGKVQGLLGERAARQQ